MYLLSLFDLFTLTVQSCSFYKDFLFQQARTLWNNFSYVLYLHFSVFFECSYIFASSLLPEKFDKKSSKIISSFFLYILSVFSGKNTAHANWKFPVKVLHPSRV